MIVPHTLSVIQTRTPPGGKGCCYEEQGSAFDSEQLQTAMFLCSPIFSLENSSSLHTVVAGFSNGEMGPRGSKQEAAFIDAGTSPADSSPKAEPRL